MGKLHLLGYDLRLLFDVPELLEEIYGEIEPKIVITVILEEMENYGKLFIPKIIDKAKEINPRWSMSPEEEKELREHSPTIVHRFHDGYVEKHYINHIPIIIPPEVSKFSEEYKKELYDYFKKNIIPMAFYLYHLLNPDDETIMLPKVEAETYKAVRKVWDDFFKIEYSNKGEEFIDKYVSAELLGSIDEFISSKIRKLYDLNKNIACVLYDHHILGSIRDITVYSRLKDLDPKRIIVGYGKYR